MHNCNHNISFKLFFICSLMVSMLAASQTYAATRGAAGSNDRQSWCQSKLDSCIKTANEDCGQDAYNDANSTPESLCKASEVTACKNAYGSTSDCETRERVTGDTIILNTTGDQKVLVTPGSSTGSTGNANKYGIKYTPMPKTLLVAPAPTKSNTSKRTISNKLQPKPLGVGANVIAPNNKNKVMHFDEADAVFGKRMSNDATKKTRVLKQPATAPIVRKPFPGKLVPVPYPNTGLADKKKKQVRQVGKSSIVAPNNRTAPIIERVAKPLVAVPGKRIESQSPSSSIYCGTGPIKLPNCIPRPKEMRTKIIE